MIPKTQILDIEGLARMPAVARARQILRERDAETMADLLELVQIPAPSMGEARRARRFQERCRECGLEDTQLDEVGNLLAFLPHRTDLAERADAAPIMIAAHLDTVFPEGTDLVPRREGSRISAPGIGDNTRGLAALLALARALTGAAIRTMHPVVFVATVGEEGAGDLRGVKHLFREGSAWRDASAFIAVDGTGRRRIVNQAIGSRRLRIVLAGPGGHSWADWGRANPIHALGQAIGELAGMISSEQSRDTRTVARIGGGTSSNTIPAEAWLELDLRSKESGSLADLEARARAAVESAVREEDQRRRAGTSGLEMRVEVMGARPAGVSPPDAPLVDDAAAAAIYTGENPELAASSTDANVPISLGIPAITLGAGGRSGGAHTSGEWYEDEGGIAGLERLLLTILDVAGPV
jgi:acetylornithine deacetylase/succinyl-diaminopimelate desuccinylase-like protein